MVLLPEQKKCFGCGSCAAVCPEKAISMRTDAEGFAYPTVNDRLCVDCGLCQDSCPANATLPQREGTFFAFQCLDETLLQKSSSGGAFSLIAEDVLSKGGLVCGACFTENFQVTHRLSDDIASMRKSKYVQSDMTDCLVPLRKQLEAGRQILFSGTPCQCHGLLTFLGYKPENLHLISLVCRGIASPGLWKDYVRWLEKGGKLERFSFRDKRRQNDGHTVSYTINGTETAVSMHQDGFCRLYNLGLTYRPCCYSCPYCSPDNDFDLTIGDFWGVEKIFPAMADGKGVSLVIARGLWANMLMSRLRDKAKVLPCSREDSLQPALLAPAKESLLRRFLFRDLAKQEKTGHSDIPLILKKYSQQE